MLLYAAFRSASKAWVEEFSLTAAAFVLLPILNLLTTRRHLGVTIPAGDWGLAGFDITMIVTGVVYAYVAVRLQCSLLRERVIATTR